MVFSPGVRLHPYEIRSALGAGGMGEVWRARDTTLGRDVALKILPDHLALDPDRLSRFKREAQILASLNHPNIATIHGFHESEGVQALVLELVEGATLADRIAQGPIPLDEALPIAKQIAEVLEAAHEQGIIHRDLKPANIKLRPDGSVKVLDFGLAKALDPTPRAIDASQSPTMTSPAMTEAGVILGTAAYMSPEQARGRSVDTRADVWAFGCVLYEMLAGRAAFARETISDTIAAILEQEPDWLALKTNTRPALRRLLQRCLQKDPRRRLRNIADVRFAIEDSVADAEQIMGTSTVANRSRRLLLTAGMLAVALASSWWVGRQSAGGPETAANPLADAQFTRFTDFPESEWDADISPDGRFVVFLSDRDGSLDVWLSQVGTGRFTNLTQGTEDAGDFARLIRGVGISQDGSEIWLAGRFPDRRLRVLPLLGGRSRVFLGEHAVNVAWSPDGASLAYHTGEPGDPMFIADRMGASTRRIFVNEVSGGHNHFPIWSRDGRWIYFVSGIWATREMDLWRLDASGGTPERLTHHESDVTYPTPIDANTVLYLSPAADGSGPWLWALDTQRKSTRRVNYGLEKYISLAASADGRRLVATVANPSASLSSLPLLDRPAGESDVTPFPVPTVRALAPRFGAGGGDFFYLSSRGDGDGLWRYQEDRSIEVWKGTDGTLFEPAAISVDGKRIAISLRGQGRTQLNVISSDGTGLTPLADTIDVRGSACWSPDGKWIVTGGLDAQGPGLFKIPVEGGTPVRLTREAGLDPVWSPDGRLIVYAGPVVAASASLLAVRADGAPVQLPTIRVRSGGERYRFMPNGEGLIYMQGEGPWQDFWLLDLARGTTRALSNLKNNGHMRTFDVAPDGTHLVFDRSRENSDIVLIDRP